MTKHNPQSLGPITKLPSLTPIVNVRATESAIMTPRPERLTAASAACGPVGWVLARHKRGRDRSLQFRAATRA